MKKLIYIVILSALPFTAGAQQFPFLEGYRQNPFSLSPAYAGIYNAGYLFSDYRTDWTGIEGGPVTCQLSYSTFLHDRMGIGGKFLFDKSDIFRQTLIMGTYSYQVEIFAGHLVNMAISAGFYRNSIDLAKYFNDPGYVNDDVLISGLERSKLKFVSDISALYRFDRLETGVLVSNLMFGTAKYNNEEISYKPMSNYLVHASYRFRLNDLWEIKPVLLVRGGQKAPSYLEIAPQAKYTEKFWGSLMFRTGGVWGLGLGAEVIDGLLLSYSYNLSSGVALNTFGSHQVGLGVRLRDLPRLVF